MEGGIGSDREGRKGDWKRREKRGVLWIDVWVDCGMDRWRGRCREG
jgi:hypothetical protein